MKTQKEKKNKNWLKKNSKIIIGIICGIFVGIIFMLIIWPERIAQNKNGEDIAFSFKGKEYTVNELYSNMLDLYNASVLVNMVDEDILSPKYPLTTAEEETLNEQADSYISYYQESYGYTEEEFLTSNGFNSYEEFVNYLKLDTLRNKYYQDYLKGLIKDKEIKDYYDKNVYGKYNTHYLAVASNDDSTEDETLIKKILKEVKAGTSYEDLKTKYDKNISSGEVIVSWDNDSNDTDYVTEAKKIKTGKCSSKYITTSAYGHTIIWVDSIDDKLSLEEEKDNIILKLSKNMDAEDSNLLYKALIELREENDFKIFDTNLNNKYSIYKKSFK